MSTYALLVDDDRDTCNLFQMVMEHNGKSFAIANDGDTALEMLAAGAPQIIIIDIVMPGLDGYQTIHRIETNQLAPRALKIATTAYHTEETQKQAAEWGFNGFLPKPFSPTELMNYLNTLSQS